jgi:hypothetical protein
MAREFSKSAHHQWHDVSDKIYILDEIGVDHGNSVLLRDAYLQRYVPAAKARGMRLEGAWRTPPIELPDRLTTLHFLWSVPDVGGWWRMRLGAARVNLDPDAGIEGSEDKLSWWSFVDSIASSRKRSFMVEL